MVLTSQLDHLAHNIQRNKLSISRAALGRKAIEFNKVLVEKLMVCSVICCVNHRM